MPHATMESIGSDMWEGRLLDHAGELLALVCQASPKDYRISLWAPVETGRNIVGSGRLTRNGDRLVGSCDELNGGRAPNTVWRVTGAVGFASLTFSEERGDG